MARSKTEFLHMRVDPQTKAEIEAGAHRRGLSISDYIRNLVRSQTIIDICKEKDYTESEIKQELNKRYGYNPYQE